MIVETLLLSLLEAILNHLATLGVSDGIPHVNFLIFFRSETRKLESKLSTIRTIFSDAAGLKEMSYADEDWLQKLHDVLHDLIDLLNPVEVDGNRNMGYKVVDFCSKLLFYITLPCKLKMINDRLDDAALNKSKFQSVQKSVGSRECEEETHSYVDEFKVKGRLRDRQEIVEQLKNPSNRENVSIFTITGMGGVGKTTLAKLVAKDLVESDRINGDLHFDLIMWVWVSKDFDLRTLLKKIIVAATKNLCQDLPLEELQRKVRGILCKKKYILVLDDVWNTNVQKWAELKGLLTDDVVRSVILATTRDMEVAQIMSNPNSRFELGDLSEEDSSSLFQELAFNPGPMDERLLAIGEEMRKKCGGNPLAISTLAGLLRVRDTQSEWSYVKNQLWNLAQENNHILPKLRRSYVCLPFQLRRCFAICWKFEKGQPIDKAALIRLWKEERLIVRPLNGGLENTGQLNRSLEDIGDDYIKILRKRSLFESLNVDAQGNILSCNMHILMHDLAYTCSLNSGTSLLHHLHS
ncbi:hypothetical protein L1049_004116 [Liquidambar formosana]|uniref:Uncharacterized protein n=1 Tax=Liquidambar formosana TaxID=63359 RepID=A0AAP0RTB1_LIQFO